ncbi:MAG: hypothetical protein IGR76_10000 [Synechococcales cyanobacterium T60_A2020_003]|nr:hypothetical protein [Synechococcales cyanobacterium T60_A2020_003]
MDSFSASSDPSRPQGEFRDPGADSSSLSTLGRGLKAIKQRDYETAIAELETVCQTATDESTLVKAQMGLVVSYARKGERRMAIALCKPLCTHSSEQVKRWAIQIMESLERSPASSDRVPQPTELTPTDDDITQLAPGDETGFAPLDQDETGFVPIMPAPPRPSFPRRPAPSSGSVTQLQTETVLYPSSPVTPTAAESETAVQDARVEPPSPSDALAPSNPLVPPAEASSYKPEWHNADRAQRWVDLVELKPVELRIVQIVTLVSIVILPGLLTQLSLDFVYGTLSFLRISYANPPNVFVLVTVITIVLFILGGSPWLLHWVLRRVYNVQTLNSDVLARRSPEAMRVLKRIYAQRRSPLPALELLPINAPVTLSYGLLPSQSYLVVSQGFLDQLQGDEMAAAIVVECSHLLNGSAAVLAGVTTVLHVPYLLYWRLATWGDRLAPSVLSLPLGWLASLCYGIFWLLQIPGYWLCRHRQFRGDRFAVSATGNPNGLTRAILKQAIGISRSIGQQRESIPVLEGCRLLMPLDDRTAMTIGSLHAHAPLAPILHWDVASPYRRWFLVRQSHALLGERLAWLEKCARSWRLEPELEFPTAKPQARSRSKALLEAAPLLGLPLGLGFGLGVWLVGLVFPLIGVYELGSLWGDRSILWGCSLVGLGFGLFMQINARFPTIRSYSLEDAPSVPDLLTDPLALPIDSYPVRLQGTLLGYRGFRNALEQDLSIKSDQGTFKLRFLSPFGTFGNLFPQVHPHDYAHTRVTVQGWLRRGALPWIDVDTITPQRGRLSRSGHPIWVTLMATLSVAAGLFIILRGG